MTPNSFKANGSFLSECLLDSSLDFELANALENSNVDGEDIQERTMKMAELCLKYLFDDIDVFDLVERKQVSQKKKDGSGDMNIVINPNDPATSFNARLNNAGLRDSIGKFPKIFTTLNVYYKAYNDHDSNSQEDRELRVNLALSLYDFLQPLWIGVEETKAGELTDIMDQDNFTEIFRRLSGFLSMVEGIVKPLIRPVEEQKEQLKNAARSHFVIKRVVDHLNCHQGYYREKIC